MRSRLTVRWTLWYCGSAVFPGQRHGRPYISVSILWRLRCRKGFELGGIPLSLEGWRAGGRLPAALDIGRIPVERLGRPPPLYSRRVPDVMLNDLDDAACKILRDYRHLMTEAERRADRAFYYQAQIAKGEDAGGVESLRAALEQSLEDPLAADFFQRGRERFLRLMARRVLAEHREELPRCSACGMAFKTPNPKLCFDCDYQQQPQHGPEQAG